MFNGHALALKMKYAILTTQCNELCKIARALNSTAISKYVTPKMTDVPSKHVW